MPQPSASDVHVDGYLTDFSTAYVQDEDKYIADTVFPRIQVQKQSDLYAVFSRSDFLRSDFERRDDGSASAGTAYTVSNAPYHTENWALHQRVPDAVVANADSPYDPYENAATALAQKEMIKRDQEWVTNFFTTSLWGADITGGTDFTEIGDAASDPVGLISDRAELIEDVTSFLPKDLVVNRRGWNKLRNHPDIIARIVGGATAGSPAILNRANVAAVLDLDRIHVASAIVNTAGEGVTASYSRIAGNHALLVYVDGQPAQMRPTAGCTFVWNQYIGSADGRRITRWRDIDTKSEVVEMDANWDQRVIGSELGVFMSGFVS